MSRLVIRDPQHPDFPHGTSVGRRRGCLCPPCRSALHVAQKKANYRRATRGPERIPISDALHAHIDALLVAVPYATVSSIALVAGVGNDTLGCALRGKVRAPGRPPKELINRKTETAVLAVTSEILADSTPVVPAKPYFDKVRQLQALGWSLREIERRMGKLGALTLAMNRDAINLRRTTAENVDIAFASIGDRSPTTREVLAGHQVRARMTASKLGFYPPAAYDADGTLNPRNIPGHPWADADTRASKRVEILELLGFGLSIQEVARRLGEHDPGSILKRVERVAASVGWNKLSETEKGEIAYMIENEQDWTLVALRLGVSNAPPNHPSRLLFEAE